MPRNTERFQFSSRSNTALLAKKSRRILSRLRTNRNIADYDDACEDAESLSTNRSPIRVGCWTFLPRSDSGAGSGFTVQSCFNDEKSLGITGVIAAPVGKRAGEMFSSISPEASAFVSRNPALRAK